MEEDDGNDTTSCRKRRSSSSNGSGGDDDDLAAREHGPKVTITILSASCNDPSVSVPRRRIDIKLFRRPKMPTQRAVVDSNLELWKISVMMHH